MLYSEILQYVGILMQITKIIYKSGTWVRMGMTLRNLKPYKTIGIRGSRLIIQSFTKFMDRQPKRQYLPSYLTINPY